MLSKLIAPQTGKFQKKNEHKQSESSVQGTDQTKLINTEEKGPHAKQHCSKKKGKTNHEGHIKSTTPTNAAHAPKWNCTDQMQALKGQRVNTKKQRHIAQPRELTRRVRLRGGGNAKKTSPTKPKEAQACFRLTVERKSKGWHRTELNTVTSPYKEWKEAGIAGGKSD